MNIIKTLKTTSWLTLAVMAFLMVASVMITSATITSDTALAGPALLDEDGNLVFDSTEERARARGEAAHRPEVKTSILPADMDVIDLLVFSIWIMTAGVGVLAVGGIVWGAVMYASAGDSQEKSKKGIEIIRNVAIGLLLYVFMFAAINFLIPGGVIS